MSISPSLCKLNDGCVTIIGAESASRDVTFYTIQVSLDNGDAWKVARRYSQFKDLHDRLISMFSIGDSGLLQLPPKRIFNNTDQNFIKKRRAELQEYLRSVILNLVPPCPQPLRIFLTEDLYDFRDVSSVLPDETSKSKTPSNVSTPSKSTLTKMSTATSKSTFWSDDNDAFGSLVDVGTTHTHASFPASKNASASAPLILAPSQLASNLVPTRPAPSVPTATQPAHNENSSPWDVGKTASNDSQLDAFGMPVFSNDNFAAKPASSVTSTSSRTTNATPSSLSGATWFPDTETQPSEAFDGRFEVSLLSGGSSRWFDGNGADGSNAAPRSMAPTAASNCNASSSGGMDLKSFLPPSFGELHFELKNQICDTFDRWKRDGGGVSRGSNTMFVDDLISF